MGNNQSNRIPVIGYKKTYVEIEKQMFAEGTFRKVYLGLFHGDHLVDGKRCVVKFYKEPYSLEREEYAWKADSRAYQKAHDMAQLFNAKYQTSIPIEFVKPEFTSVGPSVASNFLDFNTHGPSKTVIAVVERYLEGDYQKFVSNVGIVSPKEIATLAAFCHFTYDESNGQILVCDLQGVRTNTGYKLTDPSVHNSGPTLLYYGNSDLGKSGIVAFFANHTCNALCKGLKVPMVVDNSTSVLRKFEEVVGQISTGAEDIIPTVEICHSVVPEDELEKLQTNVGIVAVPSH